MLVTTLAQAADAARETAIEAPTIVAIGEIVNFRAELDWWTGGS